MQAMQGGVLLIALLLLYTLFFRLCAQRGRSIFYVEYTERPKQHQHEWVYHKYDIVHRDITLHDVHLEGKKKSNEDQKHCRRK